MTGEVSSETLTDQQKCFRGTDPILRIIKSKGNGYTITKYFISEDSVIPNTERINCINFCFILIFFHLLYLGDETVCPNLFIFNIYKSRNLVINMAVFVGKI